MAEKIEIPISAHQLKRYELVKALYVPGEKSFVLLFRDPYDRGMPMIRGYVTRYKAKVNVLNNSSSYKFFLNRRTTLHFELELSGIAGSMFINLRAVNIIPLYHFTPMM